MCLAGYRLLQDFLLVRLLVDDTTSPVFDLHRRLQGPRRAPAPHSGLALTLDFVRLRGESCRTFNSTCGVIRGLAPSSERLGYVGVAE